WPVTLARRQRKLRLIIADGQAVTPSTQPLVRGVIHALADEVNAAVAKHKLATLGVSRAETPSEVPVVLGYAVGHAGDPVVGITLVGGFLLTAGAGRKDVDRH